MAHESPAAFLVYREEYKLNFFKSNISLDNEQIRANTDFNSINNLKKTSIP